MRRIRIDGTTLEVSRWSFGTASLHHLPWRAQRESLLAEALEFGFTHFDTSPYYGYGLAEAALGLVLWQHRASVTIATKVGLYPRFATAASLPRSWCIKAAGKFWPALSRPLVDWTVRRARRSLDDSLARLGTDYVDILFLHEPVDALVHADEFLAWLEHERRDGRVRYWGVAGEADRVLPWIASWSPLAEVVQVRDSLTARQADPVVEHGRRLQYTYGYLSDAKPAGNVANRDLLVRILERNSTGSVLVSTRRKDRVRELAEAGS